jgi:putative inorganic carbon (HCO3(-)) transporter
VIGITRKLANFLIQSEIWIVLGLTGISMLIPVLLPFALTGIYLFWLLRYVMKKKVTSRSVADLSILPLVIMGIITLWVTIVPTKTIPQVERLFIGIGLFYAFINWVDSPVRLRWMMRLIIGIGLALASITPFITQWESNYLFISSPFYGKIPALIADPANPNVIAGSIAILLSVIIAYVLFGWNEMKTPERFLACMTIMLMTIVIALSQSRGAWLAISVSILCLLALRWRWFWILLAIGLVSLFVFIAVHPSALNFLVSGSSVEGVSGRVEVWSRGIIMLQDFAFTGIGLGSFTEVADAFYPFVSYQPGSMEHVHNLFLQIGIDLGMVGLLGWLSNFILVFVVGWKLYQRNHHDNQWIRALGAGILSGQIVLGIHGLLDSVVWGMVRSAPMLWLFWGIAVAAFQIKNGHALVDLQKIEI